jgi:hypothetical protein
MAFADPGIGRIILDSGRGTNPATVVLAEACKHGDVLGYSTGWKRALATVSSVIQARVVALKDGIIGESIPVSQNPLVSGYTGGTPGAVISVAVGTDNGKVTETIPSTTNDATTPIGIVLTSTTVLFNITRADALSA